MLVVPLPTSIGSIVGTILVLLNCPLLRETTLVTQSQLDMRGSIAPQCASLYCTYQLLVATNGATTRLTHNHTWIERGEKGEGRGNYRTKMSCSTKGKDGTWIIFAHILILCLEQYAKLGVFFTCLNFEVEVCNKSIRQCCTIPWHHKPKCVIHTF